MIKKQLQQSGVDLNRSPLKFSASTVLLTGLCEISAYTLQTSTLRFTIC